LGTLRTGKGVMVAMRSISGVSRLESHSNERDGTGLSR
jgi:hypothetical protein